MPKLLKFQEIQSKFVKLLTFLLIVTLFPILTNCSIPNFAKPSKVEKNVPVNAKERARKNVDEGRGISLKGLATGRRSTTYEFSTSNPMWRASLEVLDFMPLTTVDYSGGMIITDWYSDNANNDESLKISVRFMSNELRSDSLKILVHRKNCKISDNCAITLLPNNSKINSELLSVILQKAALLKEASKKKPAKK
mgnify:CR=1 FL=1